MSVAVRLARPDDYDAWRDEARKLAQAGVPPGDVSWSVEGDAQDLFATPSTGVPAPSLTITVPRGFSALAENAILHSDPERFALLYTLLVRLQDQRGLLDDHADPLVRRLQHMAKAVRRDSHKMHAFVRFREVDGRYVAWFEPDHHIVRANAGFFVRRFASMQWSILTPEVAIHWDGVSVSESPGADRSGFPDGDPVEEVWKTYYASTFNPARLKVGAMMKEMPKKYWHNMPEAALISGLVAGAQGRESRMVETVQAPTTRGTTLAALAREAEHCRRCPLYGPATQTVFGEGPTDARIMLVGEQPGDEEDRTGRAFVGPAGQVLNAALAEAGIDRRAAYITNAVKHFKFEQRGKRRIHSKPNAGEIDACRWWVEQEVALIKPAVIVMLGASAMRGVIGKTLSIKAAREQEWPVGTSRGVVTVHPSYLLRIEDEAQRVVERARFIADLVRVAGMAKEWEDFARRGAEAQR